MVSSENALSLYRCGHIKFESAITSAITEYVNDDCAERGLDMAEISVIDGPRLQAAPPALQAALAACEEMFGLQAADAQLVYCEWTWAHADISYRNSMFVSVVLATGPQPYCVQALQTGATRGEDLLDTKRIFSVGDVFVLDPCVAHMAAPAIPNSDALLVLAQWSIPAPCEEARDRVRQRFSPLAYDRHQSSLIDL